MSHVYMNLHLLVTMKNVLNDLSHTKFNTKDLRYVGMRQKKFPFIVRTRYRQFRSVPILFPCHCRSFPVHFQPVPILSYGQSVHSINQVNGLGSARN